MDEDGQTCDGCGEIIDEDGGSCCTARTMYKAKWVALIAISGATEEPVLTCS